MNRRLIALALAGGLVPATLAAQEPQSTTGTTGTIEKTEKKAGTTGTKEARASETVTVPAAPASDVKPDPLAGGYLIGPEDILDVQVWKNAELSRTVPVRPDGKVSLPLVNDIQAAGLTPTRLREQLTSRLAEYVESPEVSVIVREVHSVKVSVVGMVRMPGRYEVKSPATVLEMIAQAQGLTEFASRDRIVVIRATEGGATTRLPFNYRKAAESEKDNFFVKAGDIIFVP